MLGIKLGLLVVLVVVGALGGEDDGPSDPNFK